MKRVLFVGSFLASGKDGNTGGVAFASRSLVQSSITRWVKFIEIDSTAESIPPPPVYRRAAQAGRRCIAFLKHCLFSKPDTALIFAVHGLSFIEKGFMAYMAKLFKIRVVFAPRANLIMDDYNKGGIKAWYIRKVISISDVVLCQGRQAKEFYYNIGDGDANKYVIQYNWMDVSAYLQIERREHLNSVPKILFIGWLEKYKGIDNLVDILLELKEEGVRFEADIYGSGSLMNMLSDKVKNNQHTIRIKGWADYKKKMKALSDADLLVLPSYSEGFPNIIIEAMAAGVPVLTTLVGGLPDIIDNYKNGVAVAPGDFEALKQNLQRMLKNPEIRMEIGKNGRAYAKQHHHVENIVPNLVKIL